MVQVRNRFVGAAAGLALAGLVATGGSLAAAQDATPVGGAAMAGIPNHIHAGTCATLGEVIAPLADLTVSGTGGTAASPVASPAGGMATPVDGMATPMAGMAMGVSAAAPVAVASTQVELALSDILAAEHSINLHDPADPADPERYLACGDIGGAPDVEGNLFVGLREENDSGVTGVVWLRDNLVTGGTGTTVTVFANVGAMAGGMGGATPVASPAA
jgi:hypothetical protein